MFLWLIDFKELWGLKWQHTSILDASTSYCQAESTRHVGSVFGHCGRQWAYTAWHYWSDLNICVYIYTYYIHTWTYVKTLHYIASHCITSDHMNHLTTRRDTSRHVRSHHVTSHHLYIYIYVYKYIYIHTYIYILIYILFIYISLYMFHSIHMTMWYGAISFFPCDGKSLTGHLLGPRSCPTHMA